MKLLASLASPYSRKVRIVLAEKKLNYQLKIENAWAPDSTLAQFNPLGKIPCLVLEDGTAIFDSRVICEYLDGVTPNTRLIPQDIRARTAVKTWEALADGICDAAVVALLETRRTAEQQDPANIARQLSKVENALAALAKNLGENPWCEGVNMTLADIAVGTALGYLDFRFAQIDWRNRYKNLLRLSDELAKRSSFAETMPVAA